MGFAPQILHANDWHTAFAPLLLRSAYAWDRGLLPPRRASLRSTTSDTRGYSVPASPATSGGRGPGTAAPAGPRRRPHQPHAPRGDPRRCRHDREPDLCRGDPHARRRARTRRRPAGPGRGTARHPERRGLRRMEPGDGSPPAAPLRCDRPRRQGAQQAGTDGPAAHCRPVQRTAHRHGDAADPPEGHRSAVRGAARSARRGHGAARGAGQRRAPLRALPARDCRRAFPGLRPSTAATARSSRIASRRRPTSS